MLNRLIAFAESIQKSPDFECVFERPKPASAGRIDKLRITLEKAGHELPHALREFYSISNGLTFRWTRNIVSHPDYLTSGGTSISSIETLEASIRVVPKAPAVFDYVSDLSEIDFHVTHERFDLWYHADQHHIVVPLPLDVATYFDLLDQSRGLYPWQRLFIDSHALPLEPVLREKFFADLRLLFDDINPNAFEGNES